MNSSFGRRVVNRVLWSPAFRHILRTWAALGLTVRDPPGVTVVIVNWNSLQFLCHTLQAVRRYSSSGVRVFVIDNGSTDGSREYLRGLRDGTKYLLAPSNLKHSRALDIGFLMARTRYVVALDVDAFPIRADWIEAIVMPLEEGAVVAGAHVQRQYVHPCFLGMKRSIFVRKKHTFGGCMPSDLDIAGPAPVETAALMGVEYFDCGERISAVEKGRTHFIEPTSTRGPGALGTVFGDVVYHNFYAVRHLRENATSDMLIDGLVSRAESLAAWDEAVARYSLDVR